MKAFETGRTLPARSLDFWFDYTCPFAYLGSTQAKALAARMGVELTYRPFLLGGVFRAVGTEQKLFASLSPSKAAHNAHDMMRWADRFGVTLRMPANHPMRSVEALRATLAVKIDPRVVDAFFAAYWVDSQDIGDRAVIARVLTACGHDAEAVLANIDSEAIKADLKKRTDEAIALGIFGAPAWVVDGEHLYWGQDRIAFVEGLAKPPPKAAAPSPTPSVQPTLEVYFDFSSPWAYLGTTQVAALAERTGAKVVWKPILLGGLFRSLGGPDVPLQTFSPQKARYVYQDMHRWAEYLGAPFKFPTRFPTASLRALRVYYALPESHRDAYRKAVYQAYWGDDRDITDDAVLASCVGDDAVAKAAFATVETPEVKGAVRAATDEALAKGVFGAPTFIVNGQELIWGQDRLDLVESALTAARNASAVRS